MTVSSGMMRTLDNGSSKSGFTYSPNVGGNGARDQGKIIISAGASALTSRHDSGKLLGQLAPKGIYCILTCIAGRINYGNVHGQETSPLKASTTY